MTERRALGLVALGAVVAIAWLALPFFTGLMLGTLMAFSLEPLYEGLTRRVRRPTLASLATVFIALVIILGAAAGFVSLFVTRTVGLTTAVREQLKPGGALAAWVDAVTGWLSRFGISAESITDQLRAGAGEIASRSAGMAGWLASGALTMLLGLLFALLAMHAVLRYWTRLVATLAAVAPLRPEYTRQLLGEFRRVGRMTLNGTVLTGLAQGTLATIGFVISGVPLPFFFGFATALASLVPAVGTLLVWVPAGIYLFATDHPARAVIELAWGALVVVGFSDYVIRPRLVGDEAMPVVLTFIALFGGLEVLGLPGLVVGPVVMGVAVAVLRLYAREARSRRAAKP
jgi:predicted PurR-regulated permease PerM